MGRKLIRKFGHVISRSRLVTELIGGDRRRKVDLEHKACSARNKS